MEPPTVISGVDVQRNAKDGVERIIQLQAWAEWWVENPPTSTQDAFMRALMLTELRGRMASADTADR